MTNKLSKSVEKNLNRAGRPAGSANKSTSMAREAIARFVEGNAHKMEEWLTAVAEGKQDPKTQKWLIPPNPEKAFGMLQTVMEYHVPKLARTEVVGDVKAPVRMVVTWKK
jgi:hypothetical protein